MNELNPKQRVAAEFKEGIAAVIAVPGSGKTRTMMERIGILVTRYGIAPESILGLTFTKNAAEEMKNRLVPVLGELSARVKLSTIHSFCHHLLKSEGRVYEILSGKEQLMFIKAVMKRLKVKEMAVGTILQEISLAKNNLIDPGEFKALFEHDATMTRIAQIYAAYDEEKAKGMLLDFDDLLLETHKLLLENVALREKYQQNFDSILVDEFQDTNPVQFEILKLLIRAEAGHQSFWVAGDDHQSIYSFMGASVGNILNFQAIFPQSKQFILDLNYRSTPQILNACQNLIAHNMKQIHKNLSTHNPDGEDIVILASSSEETEALCIVNEIKDLIERRGFKYSDMAVLYRANFQSRYVEEAFCQHKIPYHIQNGQSFYDRFEVKCLLDYLRVFHDPDSEEGDQALLNILNIPNRYIGNKIKDQLREFAKKRGLHLYQAMKSMTFEAPYIRKNAKGFIAFMDTLMEEGKALAPARAILEIRSAWDYDRFMVDEDIPSPDDVKISNINQLQLAAARYHDIGSFLAYTDSFQDETVSDDKEGVHLMTVHKAKGLEFPVVFVIGLVEGLLPSKKGNIEEERRICFVAISRAMQLLFLSYPATYLGQPSKKSIFLSEILGKKEPAPQKTAA